MPENDLSAPLATRQITVQPQAQQCAAQAGDTVLLAVLRAGVEWPSACRNGTCRACMGRLLAGQIRYQIEWPGLSAEEKAEGCFLPCVACAVSDLEVRVL